MRGNTLESHPTLELGLLQRGGLFKANGPKSLVIRHYITYIASWLPDENAVKVETIFDDAYNYQVIQLERSPVGFGNRLAFLCPVTGRRCRILHIYYGRFVSREARPDLPRYAASSSSARRQRLANDHARLLGTDGRSPARGRNRARIVNQLAEESWVDTHWADVAEESDRLIDRAVKVSQRKAGLIKTGPLSTAVGLIGGASFSALAEVIEEGIPEAKLNRDIQFTTKARVQEVPAIDLPTLIAATRATGEEVREFTLLWDHGPIQMQVHLTIDLRRAYLQRIQVRNLFGSDLPPNGLTADLIQTGNNRDRFLCPITKKPADTLFIREGVLGSRAALNLTYPCEEWSHRSARRKSLSKPFDQERFLSTLDKYGIPKRQFFGPSPEDIATARLLEQFYTARYQLALQGNWPAIKSIWDEYGIWDEPVEAAEILDGDARAAFMDELAQTRQRGGLFLGREFNWVIPAVAQ